MKNYEATDYPKIYKNVPWGGHTIYDTRPLCDEILKNRNDFIKEHGIVAQKDASGSFHYNKIATKNRYTQLMDHEESYEDAIGRIIYVYSKHPNSIKPIPLYRQIKPIYRTEQNTMMRKYETPKSTRLLMKTIYKSLPDDVVGIINSFIKKTPTKKSKKH